MLSINAESSSPSPYVNRFTSQPDNAILIIVLAWRRGVYKSALAKPFPSLRGLASHAVPGSRSLPFKWIGSPMDVAGLGECV